MEEMIRLRRTFDICQKKGFQAGLFLSSNSKQMKNRIELFYWLPRILCIAAILFISVFAADAFQAGQPFLQQLFDFAMHLIPSVLLVLVLILAWKHELIGGILFTLIGIVCTYPIYRNNFHNNHSVWTSLSIVLLITVPFIVIGILFILSDFLKRRKSKIHEVPD
jgi:cell division protein FtsW (lipid II flippase)